MKLNRAPFVKNEEIIYSLLQGFWQPTIYILWCGKSRKNHRQSAYIDIYYLINKIPLDFGDVHVLPWVAFQVIAWVVFTFHLLKDE